MSDQISNKDLISKFKDYADIADASYAMLQWINENEDDGWFDKFKDSINKGHEKEINETTTDEYGNEISQKVKQPTAYALAIEARFNQDTVIFKK